MTTPKRFSKRAGLALILSASVALAACSSDDDDDDVIDGTTTGVDAGDAGDDGADGADDGADGADDGADGADGADDGADGADGGGDDAGGSDGGDATSAAGTFQFLFTNTSATQPMTPPVVVLHTPLDDDGGIQIFEVGTPASTQVIAIAEDGNNVPLVEALQGQVGQTISAFSVVDTGEGPLSPGEVAELNITTEADGQVMSLVSMVICTNDGFSGVNSAPLPDDTVTVNVPVYDAGSESNVLELDYWVPPCGTETNITDDEGGVIAAHPGQAGSENPDFDFPAASSLLEVTVTRN